MLTILSSDTPHPNLFISHLYVNMYLRVRVYARMCVPVCVRTHAQACVCARMSLLVWFLYYLSFWVFADSYIRQGHVFSPKTSRNRRNPSTFTVELYCTEAITIYHGFIIYTGELVPGETKMYEKNSLIKAANLHFNCMRFV